MKSKLTKEEYKKYSFPLNLLLHFIFVSIISVVLLDLLATLIINAGVSGFWDKLAGIVVMLLAGGAVWFLIYIILPSRVKKNKVYRGIGFMRVLKIVSIFCPILFVVTIIVLNVVNVEHNFFNIVTLFVEFATPFVVAIEIRKRITVDIFICPSCGLINTYSLTNSKSFDLGRHHKFHNEGGYRRTTKTSIGVIVQDVPTAAVYDGEFQKWCTEKTYNCSICGDIKLTSNTSEIRVD